MTEKIITIKFIEPYRLLKWHDKKNLNAKSFLITGDWATAQYEMSLITVGGAYTQELNDDITGQINNYIILNY